MLTTIKCLVTVGSFLSIGIILSMVTTFPAALLVLAPCSILVIMLAYELGKNSDA